MRWVGHVSRKGKMRTEYKILVGKTEVKRPLGRHWRKSYDIKTDLQEIDCGGEEWLRTGYSGGLF
jgi:hypothetical protein